jgi:sugar O-acyltransferase (sialic acid O-acetyltransferase NeuD family)
MDDAMTELVILGAGRGSAELIDLIVDERDARRPRAGRPLSIAAVLDDRFPDCAHELLGVPITGTTADIRQHLSEGRKLLMGIANARNRAIRRDIDRRLALPDSAWSTFVHEDATVSSRATLGAGTILYPGVRIATDAKLGRNVVVYYNSVIHHDANLGDGVTVCAGVNIAGNVTIGEGSYLGIGCTIRDGITIGDEAFICMGAVVTRDVAAREVVKP